MIRRCLATSLLLVPLGFLALLIAAADDLPRKVESPSKDQPKLAGAAAAKPILGQSVLGENGCGPCALLNCLKWGDADLQNAADALPGKSPEDKVRGLIERYGNKPSEEYGAKVKRYDPGSGITWIDFKHFVNEVCADQKLSPITGNYLDRQKDEELTDHLQRVFKQLRTSLDAGFPPMLSVRSFAAQAEGNKHVWNGLQGHWVAVVELPATLAENEKGFRFGYLDSYTGKLEYGYAFIDEARNFTAAKGNVKKWEWLTDRPFLLVTAPSFRLKTQNVEWHDRTIIILNYVICRGK